MTLPLLARPLPSLWTDSTCNEIKHKKHPGIVPENPEAKMAGLTRIYLINLERSRERLKFMSEQFETLSLSAERLPAVDARQIDLGPFAHLQLTPGEIGCFLSHRAAWERLFGSGEQYALILEDDTHLSPELPKLIADMSWFPKDATAVKMETSRAPVILDPTEHPAPMGRKLRRLRTAHMGTGAYIVCREGAGELLRASEDFREPVDNFMFSENALKRFTIYQMVPAAAIQQFHMEREEVQFVPSEIVPERAKRKAVKKRPSAPIIIVREVRRAIRKFRFRTIPRLIYRTPFSPVPFR